MAAAEVAAGRESVEARGVRLFRAPPGLQERLTNHTTTAAMAWSQEGLLEWLFAQRRGK